MWPFKSKKYKLTGDVQFKTKIIGNVHHTILLYRIKALRSFNGVRKGQLGGYVQSELNLSHDGNCWIYDDAKVFDNGLLSGDSTAYNNSEVFGHGEMHGHSTIIDNAQLYGDAVVTDDCDIGGYAKVYDNVLLKDNVSIDDTAEIYGYTRIENNVEIYGSSIICGKPRLSGNIALVNCFIKSNADFFVAYPVGSENGQLVAYRTTNGIAVKRGCFEGTLEEFESRVKETHDYNQFARRYNHLITYIRNHFT